VPGQVIFGKWKRARVVDDEAEYDLSIFEDFAKAVNPQLPANHPGSSPPWLNINGYYCVACAGKRRVSIRPLHWPIAMVANPAAVEDASNQFIRATLFEMTCVQCHTSYSALVHEGPEGWEVAIFSKERGGLSTPNSPVEVAYYLDQAHRAESVGALSAAAAMYRSALEMLLHKEGYEKGMLNTKITDLLADKSPPASRDQIDSDYLDALKQIGNAAIHPNDGDISKQAALDRELLIALRAVFTELLDTIYERPAIEAARKAQLSGAIQSFKNPPAAQAQTSTAAPLAQQTQTAPPTP
jgi:hypothetical protein